MGPPVRTDGKDGAGFQSTHPVRGGTLIGHVGGDHADISIHPPREGWDRLYIHLLGLYDISIHPPREGWDVTTTQQMLARERISIHPPREGWDKSSIQIKEVI